MQMLSIYRNSETPSNMTKEMIEEIQSEVIHDYEYEKNNEAVGDESDEENKPENDECPACFGKITPDDEVCPHCGYKLK